jgi:hypothetical protein
MSVVNCYKVIYFYTNANGKNESETFQDFVCAADSNSDTLRAVLVANGRVRPSKTIYFTSIANSNMPQALS